ncbi:histidine kinase N-terminal 7TM domain-containing protein [Bacteroidota bacterium]
MSSWQFTPIAILYIIAAIIAFSLSFFVGQIKAVRGKTFFRFLTLFSGIWTLAYTLMFFSTEVAFKLIMLRIEYLGVICAATFWLLFVLSYTNSDNWLTKRIIGLIFIIPAVTFIQILTFQYHKFYYLSFKFIELDGFLITEKEYGPGFYIWIVYSYFILLLGGVILIRSIMNMPVKFRRQILPIIISLVVILIPNFLYIIGKNPIAPHDPTCLSFVIVGLLFFMIIYVDKFLNIVPVAYNLVFKNTKSGVIIINDNGTILDVNPSAENIFGIKQQEMVGLNVLDYLTDFEDAYENLLKDQEFRGELDFTQSNRHYELISASLKDYKKRIIGRILVFYDITKRKLAHFELDAYARTVAHDLKSPMSSILGFAEILNYSNNLDKDEQGYCKYIYDGIIRMTDIIDGLLLLAQVRNQEEIEIKEIRTDEILKKVLLRLDDLIKKYDCTIQISDKWPLVLGYPIWIEEIWVNYISNAIKYGGDPPKVELGAKELKDSVKFWVKDNGEGIASNEVKDLFKEFSQLENRKSATQGYGLGLSIVERIASKLNGTVGVESEPGDGSLFYFTLPKSV